MEYRKFGPLDWQVSVLGFGCARLPTINGVEFDPGIDEDTKLREFKKELRWNEAYYYLAKGIG